MGNAPPYKDVGSAMQLDTRTEQDAEFHRMTCDSILVMSFNLRAMDQPDKNLNSWSARKRAVVRVLQKYGPDFVATQEGFMQQLRDICTALPHYKPIGKSRCHPDDQEHCAVLVDTDVFDVLSEETVWLSEHPEKPKSKSWDSSLPRIATIVNVAQIPSNRICSNQHAF